MGSFASHSHRCRHVEPPRLGFAEKRSDGSPGTVVRGFWSIACQTLAAHEVSHAIAADRESFSGQVPDHPAVPGASFNALALA